VCLYNVLAVFNAIDNISGVASGIGMSVEGLSSKVTSLGQNMLSAGGQMTMAFTAPLLAAAGAAIKLGVDYESAMTKVATLTGSNAAQIVLYKEKIQDLATFLPQSMSALAEGLYYVASAGYRGQEAIDVLTNSAKAAANSMGSVEVVAQAVTSALAAYGLKGSESGRVTDILTQAVIYGKLEFDELAGSIGRVLPIAAAAGVSLEEVAASLSTMSLTGLNAEEAATALRSALMSLFAPSKGATDALMSMGLSADDVRASIREKGLLATLRMLMDLTNGNVTALDAIIPNVRGLVAVLATAGSQSEVYATILKEVSNSLGVTDRAFEITAQTARVQMGLFRNSLEGVGLLVSSVLIPPLLSATNTLRGWLYQMREADPATLRMVITIAALVAGAGPLLMLLGGLTTGFGALLGILGFLLSPIGLVIAGVVALGVAWATNWGGIRDATMPIITQLGALLAQAITWLSVNVPAALAVLSSWWQSTWPQIQAVATTAWNGIQSVISTILAFVVPFVLSQVEVIRSWFTANWPLIHNIVSTAWTGIQSVINFVINQVVPFVISQVEVIRSWFVTNWPLMQQVITTVWTAIQTQILDRLTAIITSVSNGLGQIRSWFEQHSTEIRTIVNSAWTIIQTLVSTAINLVLGVIRTVMLLITGDWQGAWTQIQTTTQSVWSGIQTIAQTAVTAVKAAITIFLSDARGLWEAGWSAIQTATSTALSTIQNTANSILTGIATFFTTTWNGIKTGATTVWTDVRTAVVNGLTNAANAIRGFDLAAAGRALMDGLMGGVQSKVQGIIDAVTGGVQAAIDAARRLLGLGSPSKVFEDMGVQTFAGMTIGVEAGSGNAVRKVADVLKRMTDVAAKGRETALLVLNSILAVFSELVLVSEADTKRESTMLVELAMVIQERLVGIQNIMLNFVAWVDGPFRAMLLSIDLSGAGMSIGNSLAAGLLAALPAVRNAAALLAAAAAGTGSGEGATSAGGGMMVAGATSALAYAGAAAGRGSPSVTVRRSETHVHIGTFIGDEAGLRELERRLRPVREQEENRRGI